MPVPVVSEERPWGTFTILLDTSTHKVKQIVVRPHQRLSYQLHHKRAEHWFVVAGTGQAIIDDVTVPLTPGTSIDIPVETKHRVANTGDTDMTFIEVQTGTYFGEDDIIRFEDDYART